MVAWQAWFFERRDGSQLVGQNAMLVKFLEEFQQVVWFIKQSMFCV